MLVLLACQSFTRNASSVYEMATQPMKCIAQGVPFGLEGGI